MLSFERKSTALCMLLVTGCLLTCSCTGAEQKANELYELAVFEEKQFNSEHAIELYERIVKEYPGTETADKAIKALRRLKSKGKVYNRNFSRKGAGDAERR